MSNYSMMQLADFDIINDDTKKKLDRLFYQCNIFLGGSSIPVHLEDPDYNFAFEKAVQVYRTASSRSVFQTFGFLELEPTKQTYVLNSRVDVVQKVTRTRGIIGANSGSFESFGAATANVLLRGSVGANSANFDLTTYDFLYQYEDTLERLFAREINFVYRNETKTLIIHQTPRYKETVALKVSVLKSIGELLDDHFSQDWLQRYTLAQCRVILGEKYSLFGSIPGAQGGSSLKGDSLIQRGNDDLQKLEELLYEYSDSSDITYGIRG